MRLCFFCAVSKLLPLAVLLREVSPSLNHLALEQEGSDSCSAPLHCSAFCIRQPLPPLSVFSINQLANVLCFNLYLGYYSSSEREQYIWLVYCPISLLLYPSFLIVWICLGILYQSSASYLSTQLLYTLSSGSCWLLLLLVLLSLIIL